MPMKHLTSMLLLTTIAVAQKTSPDLNFNETTLSNLVQNSRSVMKKRDTIPIIVQYAERNPEKSIFTATQRKTHGRLLQSLDKLDVEILEVTAQELEALKADRNVTYISPADREVSGFLDKENNAINFWQADDYLNACCTPCNKRIVATIRTNSLHLTSTEYE